jgi:hypothetical protein
MWLLYSASMCRYQHNHPLTSRSSGLLRKLTVAQLAKKFPVFYRTRRFSTVFTKSANPSPFSAGRFYSCKIQHNITLRSMPRPQKRYNFFQHFRQKFSSRYDTYDNPNMSSITTKTLSYAIHKELWLLSQNCSEADTLTSNCSRWSPYVLSTLVAKTTLWVMRAAVWMPAGTRDFSDL